MAHFTRQADQHRVILKIEGALTIYEAPEAREQLLACLESFQDTIIDLSAVNAYDTSGLQVLIAGHKTARSTGKVFATLHATTHLTDTMTRLGLDINELPTAGKEE